MKYFFAFIIALSTFNASAYNRKTDSLLTLLKKDKEDTLKVKHLYALCWNLRVAGKMDSALQFGNEAVSIAKQIGFTKGIAYAYNSLGVVYWGEGDYSKAIEYYLKALQLFEKINNKRGIGITTSNIGIVYYNQGEYQKALTNFFKALKTDEQHADRTGIELLYENIGSVYEKEKDFSKALDYFLKALKLGNDLGNKSGIARSTNSIGNIYADAGDLPKALQYLFDALKIGKTTDDRSIIAGILGDIGKIYLQQKKYKESETYYLRGLKTANEIHLLESVKEFNEKLSRLYSETGKVQQAFDAFKNFTAAKDSLFNIEKNKEITMHELNYVFDKKEAAAKADADKQAAIAETENKKQRIISWSVAAGLLLVIIFAAFIFRSLRTTRIQKIIIEEKQREILDSIHYAKRIQHSLLPTTKYIDKSFKRLMRS